MIDWERHKFDEQLGDMVERAKNVVRESSEKSTGGKKARRNDPRVEKMNQIASSIVMGDMGEIREQVINHFNGINKVFRDGWNSDTMLHMICREGLTFSIEKDTQNLHFFFKPLLLRTLLNISISK